MDKQTAEARKTARSLPAKKRIEHFWNYYKFHAMIGLVLMIAVVATMVQRARQIDYDLEVSMYVNSGLIQEDVEFLTEVIKGQSYDLNDNGSVDVRILKNAANITDESKIDDISQGILQKLMAELTANDCPGYIMDEAYKDYLSKLNGFSEGVKSTVKISEIPELKEKLHLDEDDTLYWVTLAEYGNAKGNEMLLKKYELVGKIEEYFKNCIEE